MSAHPQDSLLVFISKALMESNVMSRPFPTEMYSRYLMPAPLSCGNSKINQDGVVL